MRGGSSAPRITCRSSSARLDPGPEPVHQALGLGIAGVDGVEPLHRRLVRIDRLVVEDRLVDEFPARAIAVRIGKIIRVARRDLGALQVVDECVGLRDIEQAVPYAPTKCVERAIYSAD